MPCARVLLLLSTVLQMSVGFCTTSPLVRLQSEISLRRSCLARAQGVPPLLDKPSNSSGACLSREASLARQNADLARRVCLLETTLAAVFSSLLHCDDMALLERQASGIGDIYLDSGFTSTRKPRMLRQELRRIAATQGIVPMPIMHSWQYRAHDLPPM